LKIAIAIYFDQFDQQFLPASLFQIFRLAQILFVTTHIPVVEHWLANNTKDGYPEGQRELVQNSAVSCRITITTKSHRSLSSLISKILRENAVYGGSCFAKVHAFTRSGPICTCRLSRIAV
jgi:hypothetical protein